MLLGSLFLMAALFWSVGILMPSPNQNAEHPFLKTEGRSSQPTKSSAISIRVLWTVSEYKIGKNAVWGDEEACKLLFKPLDIDDTKIIFDGKTCQDVIFKQEKVNAKEYLDYTYHTTPQALGIDQGDLEVIKTNCDLPGFAEYMRLRDGGLIIQLSGVFFYFKPAVNY